MRPGWRWVAVLAAVLIALVALVAVVRGSDSKRMVAYFRATVGVYPGSDVRVLGVRIGTVESITPQGDTVRVELNYQADYQVPADVRAIVVPPSVVSDRYIQLEPAYSGGPVLPDDAEVPVSRTAAPLELDDIYRALDELNRALGPDGANADGALADLVAVGRANMEGNGEHLHDTLDGLAQALSTLAEGREDLFGTVANLQQFTTALAESDAAVRIFNGQLADVAEQLAGEKDELTEALHRLALALAEVTTFIRDNRAELVDNVAALTDITGILVRQQQAMIDVLDFAPLALSNLALSYNPSSGTTDTRNNATGPHHAAEYLCSLLAGVVPETELPAECFDLATGLPALPPGGDLP